MASDIHPVDSGKVSDGGKDRLLDNFLRDGKSLEDIECVERIADV